MASPSNLYAKFGRVSSSRAFIETQAEEFSMSGPKKPMGGGNVPPPIDPDRVQEIAADEVLSIEVGGGMATLVFGKRRIIEQGPGRPPRIERVVKCRLVLSISALDDMMNQLIALNRATRQFKPPSGDGGPTAH
jgi:hypothetical protein